MAPSAPPIAIVDTNVIIDFLSCHDYLAKLLPALKTVGDQAWLNPDITYRLIRARDALLLMIHFHETGATTFGSNGELGEILGARVPPAPGEDGGRDWTLDYLTQSIHVVMPMVLKGWTHTCPAAAESERKSAGDQWLVDEAFRHGVPLITNEGLKTDGTIDLKKGMWKKAAAAGVQALTPRGYFSGRLANEDESSEAFMARFARVAEDYVKGRTDHLHRVLKMMGGSYQMVFAMGDLKGNQPLIDLSEL